MRWKNYKLALLVSLSRPAKRWLSCCSDQQLAERLKGVVPGSSTYMAKPVEAPGANGV
jgi:hypothetical protein